MVTLPAAALMVCAPLNATGTSSVCALAELLVKPPARVSVLAALVMSKLPAPLLKVSELTLKLASRLFVSWVVPANAALSPGPGDSPKFQFPRCSTYCRCHCRSRPGWCWSRDAVTVPRRNCHHCSPPTLPLTV